MTTRTFPTDAQLDQFLDTMPAPETLPTHTLDQLQAASRETGAMGPRMAASAIATGGWAFLGSAPQDLHLRRKMLKPAVRMLLAAFSAGNVTRLCEHANQIRPTIVLCDPPTIVCTQPACVRLLEQTRETARFLWDNQCDSCGGHAPTVFPYLTALGPVTVSGHLCQACSDLHTVDALGAADAVQPVTRKSPCPCDSGRRYKHCHGKEARR
ncbi:SEC-C metal-binding domain-containing protein [Streptomyces sp. H27-H5]|uniref:SEC-C metal-binding domain-containing protein n=1 Tax=Streptomyces sp. H27-H5 TaxID=2996460 RepID=UPI00226E1917|nr:SEC-C metal-binding domain-containing protein [Streptomyces sp. H27-H5]MCY0962798.1 SEC-C metal-binding domain-containing protein [Streptomyces sp. H27-H5]